MVKVKLRWKKNDKLTFISKFCWPSLYNAAVIKNLTRSQAGTMILLLSKHCSNIMGVTITFHNLSLNYCITYMLQRDLVHFVNISFTIRAADELLVNRNQFQGYEKELYMVLLLYTHPWSVMAWAIVRNDEMTAPCTKALRNN